jgi:hypothetical protein
MTNDTANPVESKSKTRGRHFSMTVVNFCLDALLLGLFALYGWVLGVLRFVFPVPSAAEGWSLWGWNFDRWWDFQFSILCAFAIGILIHVMLHWNWVCSVVTNQILQTRKRPDESMQTIYGVGLLIILLHLIAFGLIAAKVGVHRPPQ